MATYQLFADPATGDATDGDVRIIQEALTNVLRHAGARTVRLALALDPSRVLIRIRDDGSASDAADGCGYGIDGMRERARALSGQLTVGPHPEGGFEVRAELPVTDARDDVRCARTGDAGDAVHVAAQRIFAVDVRARPVLLAAFALGGIGVIPAVRAIESPSTAATAEPSLP